MNRLFDFKGTNDDWKLFRRALEDNGQNLTKKLNTIISQELSIIKHEQTEELKTAAKYEDILTDRIAQTNLRDVIVKNKYHIIIDDIKFIKSAGIDLEKRVKSAVYNGVYNYWVSIMAESRLDKYMKEYGELTREQAISQLKSKINVWMEPTYERIRQIDVTFDVDIPMVKLHELREIDLNEVIQFNCLVIGPGEVKIDTETGQYIQHVLIQELEEEAHENSPKIMKIMVHGNDTKKTQSGKHLKIVGQYKMKQALQGAKATNEVSLTVDSFTLKDIGEEKEVMLTKQQLRLAKEAAEYDEKKYVNDLINSFCPKIYGRYLEKKALYLSLLGGTDVEGYRKESHLMMVGEADTGKSELVKFANSIAHKSSIVDGSNTTGVGILFALDEYDGTKILRAGSFILNNGGHIIVDEYDKMPKIEQKKLNQAMEQQRASYNKGGHRANAETKTAVIASCNPQNERWNEDKTLIDNLPFDASTVSRYDLLIRLKHDNHENQVRAKMEHIVRNKRGDRAQAHPPEYLKGLLNYLKKLKPRMNDAAEKVLIDKFVEFTQIEQVDGALPIQTRQMEGIQRMCEAWAKLTFKTEITPEMVEETIEFYKECLSTLGMNVDKGITQMDLRGNSINRDEFFDTSFKGLENDNDEVLIHDLGEVLLDSKHFNTAEQIHNYMVKKVKAGMIYEPRPGVWKRQ